jgi:hypothetical protein
MHHGLGVFDNENCRVEAAENRFEDGLLIEDTFDYFAQDPTAPPEGRAAKSPVWTTLAEDAGRFPGSAARLALLSGEELMQELNRDRAFTDRGGDTLDRTVADIAGGEHAWHARLEEKRTATGWRCATLRDIRSREDESLHIPFDVRR